MLNGWAGTDWHKLLGTDATEVDITHYGILYERRQSRMMSCAFGSACRLLSETSFRAAVPSQKWQIRSETQIAILAANIYVAALFHAAM